MIEGIFIYELVQIVVEILYVRPIHESPNKSKLKLKISVFLKS